MAASPDGSFVVVAGEADSAVAVFRRESASGLLEFVGVHRESAEGVEGLTGITAVAVSPASDHVYTAGRDHGAVSAFRAKAEQQPATPEKQ